MALRLTKANERRLANIVHVKPNRDRKGVGLGAAFQRSGSHLSLSEAPMRNLAPQ